MIKPVIGRLGVVTPEHSLDSTQRTLWITCELYRQAVSRLHDQIIRDRLIGYSEFFELRARKSAANQGQLGRNRFAVAQSQPGDIVGCCHPLLHFADLQKGTFADDQR